MLGPIASLAAATAAAAHSRYPRRRADAPAVRGAGRSDKGRLSRGRRQPQGNACTRTREVHRGATSRERARERSMALCAGYEEHRLPVVLVVHVQVRARVQQQVDAPHPLARIPRRVREHARARHLQRGLPPIFGARLGVAPEPQQMTDDLLLPKKDSVGQDGTRSDGCGAEIQGFEGQMAIPKAAGVAPQEQCGHHLRSTMQDGIAKGPRVHPEDHALLAPPKEDIHHGGGLRVGARRVNRRDQSPRAHLRPVADHRVVDTLVAGRRHQRLQADGIASADGSMKVLVDWHGAVLEQQGQRGRAPRLERGVDARLQLLQGSARAAGERKQERRQKGPVSSGHDELEGSHVFVGTRVGSARDVQARSVLHHQVRCNGGVVEGARQREEGAPVGRLSVGRHTHLVDEKTHTLRGAKRDGRREKRAADDAAVIVVRWKLRHCEDGVVHQRDVDPRVAGRAERRSDGHVSVRTSHARQGSDDENATRPRWIAVTTRAMDRSNYTRKYHRARKIRYCICTRATATRARENVTLLRCADRKRWRPTLIRAGIMLYAHYLDAIAMAVDEVIVPGHMDLLSLLSLLLTSKQLRNKINARPCIAQHIKATIGIPNERVRHPTKLLTFFQIRRGAKQIPHSLLAEYGLAMQSACIGCLRHVYLPRRAFRNGKFHEYLFTNHVDSCEPCENLPCWSKKKRACTHPSHVSTERRSNHQIMCAECFAAA